ncbi:MAG TPA: lipase family protein [Bryobacteraceae bacterium]|jgi:triacylglycerol lipase
MPLFDPNSSTLSLPNARLLAHAAATAYKTPDTCRQWAADNNFPDSFTFFSNTSPRTDTNGFLAQNDQSLVIAFRGTDPHKPIDWFIDFNALQEHGDFPEARVHKGFEDALNSVWPQITPALTARGNRTVWITGHSLGGALAELAAAKSALIANVPVQGIYTFGQPRVGDEAFSRRTQEALGTRAFRFINNRDIVPRVPLFGMGYRHYANEIFFDNDAQEDRPSALETLLAAIRLAIFALDLNLAEELLSLGKALLTDNQAVAKREEQLLGNPRLRLAAGIANITDHDMATGYIPRLGA